MDIPGAQHGGTQDASTAPARSSPNDCDTYRMMVLRFDQPEEEVDEQLVQTALDLGIDVSRPPSPPTPKSSIADVTEEVSALDIGPALSEPSMTPEPSIQSSSQTSGSSNAQSDSSMEYKRHAKTPSFTAISITSIPSINSITSQISSRAKVKKGIRRISTLRRRKLSNSTTPPPQTPTYPLRPSSQHQRAAMTDQALNMSHLSHLQPHALTTDEPAITTNPARPVNSASPIKATDSASPLDSPSRINLSLTPPGANTASEHDKLHDLDIAPPPSPSTLEAQHRSLNHPVLKKLRTSQLQEQLRFISFQASQIRLMRTAHLQAKRNTLTLYKTRQFHLENAHADALVSLEQRHLGAEVDLRKGLEAESKNCDVKLKHMQAYCNPRNHVEGMPRREVTKADHRKLEQQYHIRNSMDSLHTSKINVLREKQAKQVERIMAKQQAELQRAETDFEQENIELDQRFREEDKSLDEEFQQRRKRLVRRWRLIESIERRKLELETGEEFGIMPEIVWGEEDMLAKRGKESVEPALSVDGAKEEVENNGSKEKAAEGKAAGISKS